jgi:hypothetical protein
MAIVITIIAQIQLNQMKGMKALNEKVAVLDFEKVLISSLADGSTCQHVTNLPVPLTFNSTTISSTTPVVITPTLPLYSGVKLGVPGPVIAQVGQRISPNLNSVVVDSIRLVITEGNAGQFKGYWEVALNPNGMTRPLKPLRIQTVLAGDVTVPTSARITSCMGSASSAPVITRRNNNVTAWRWPSATINCLADEYVVSGGGVCVSLGPPGTGFMFLNTSRPTTTGEGWIVSCDTPRNQNARAEVYALCAKR